MQTVWTQIRPDKTYVRPELDPNCLTLMVFLKEYFKKVNFEKKSDDKKKCNITLEEGKELKSYNIGIELLDK